MQPASLLRIKDRRCRLACRIGFRRLTVIWLLPAQRRDNGMRFLHRKTVRKRTRIGQMVLICLVALTATFLAGPANAYNLEGAKWAGTPNSGCCATIHASPNGAADSSGLNIMSSFDANGFRDALSAWNGSPANVLLDFHSGALTLYDP